MVLNRTMLLQYIHSGGQLRVIGDSGSVKASKSSVHRMVMRVSKIIASHVSIVRVYQKEH